MGRYGFTIEVVLCFNEEEMERQSSCVSHLCIFNKQLNMSAIFISVWLSLCFCLTKIKMTRITPEKRGGKQPYDTV